MRNISFMLTVDQFIARTKTVTRRLGWAHLIVGQQLMGCEKCMGLKPGDKINKLGVIEVVSLKFEPLNTIAQYPNDGREECVREGFPGMIGVEFVTMFCLHMKTTPLQPVSRIEFKYL